MTVLDVPIGTVIELPIRSTDPRKKPDSEFIYVDIASVNNRTKRIESPTTLDGRNAPTRARQIIKRGDVLVATTRPYLNAVAQVPEDLDGQVCSTGFAVLRPGDSLDSDYLFHWVQHPQFVDGLSQLVQGALYPAVTDRQVLAQSIPLPQLDEQRRIVVRLIAKLSAVELLLGRVGEERARVAELAESTRAEAFGRLTSARYPLSEIVSDRLAITDGPFGSNLKTDHYVSQGVRVVRLANIGRGEFLDVDRAYISEDHYRGLTRHSAKANDVVVAALGDGVRPAGRACTIPVTFGEGLVKADCFRVRVAGSSLEPDFLMHYLNSPTNLRAADAKSRGATRPRMTLDMLKNTKIPVPDRNTQRDVVSKLTNELHVARSLETNGRKLAETTRSLQRALLREAFATSA